MSVNRIPLRWDTGDAIYEVSDVLELTEFADGEWREYEIDHKDVLCNSEDPRLARFSLSELPEFAEAAGFVILPVLSGTNGSQFRVWIGYIASEMVYGMGYATPETGAGDAVVTWSRKGVLASDA